MSIIEEVGDSNPYGAKNYAHDGWGYAEVKLIDEARKSSGGKKRFAIDLRVLYHEPEQADGPTHQLGDTIDVGVKLTGHTDDWQRTNDLGRINAHMRAMLIPNFLPATVSRDDFKKALAGCTGPAQQARGIVVRFVVKKAGPKYREVTLEPVLGQVPADVKARRAAQDAGNKPAPWAGAPVKSNPAPAPEPVKMATNTPLPVDQAVALAHATGLPVLVATSAAPSGGVLDALGL